MVKSKVEQSDSERKNLLVGCEKLVNKYEKPET